MSESEQVFCGGQYVARDEARISPFDRGFLFADAVYEVSAVMAGRLVDNDFHLARLKRSLGELDMPLPMSLDDIEVMQKELVKRNKVDEGTVYIQVSRGDEGDRNFLYPEDMKPSLFAFTSSRKLTGTKSQREGIAVDLLPDPRWVRRDIKTVMLLAQVLAKKSASRKGFDDAWFVEDGLITEGASATAFIITKDGRVVTRANSQAILPGCTRRAVEQLCKDEGIAFEERAFSPEEAFEAAEAFLTSASGFVTPVIRITDRPIGDAKPGKLTRHLQDIYLKTVCGIVDKAPA